MPLIEYTIDGKIARVKQAVQRIRWGYAEKPGSIWTSGGAVYDWWLEKKTIHQIDGQETLW